MAEEYRRVWKYFLEKLPTRWNKDVLPYGEVVVTHRDAHAQSEEYMARKLIAKQIGRPRCPHGMLVWTEEPGPVWISLPHSWEYFDAETRRCVRCGTFQHKRFRRQDFPTGKKRWRPRAALCREYARMRKPMSEIYKENSERNPFGYSFIVVPRLRSEEDGQ
jgi:hypothetical protein